MSIRKEDPLTNAQAAKLLEDGLGAEGLILKEFTPGEVVVLPMNQSVVEAEATAKGTRMPRVQRMPTPRRVVPEKP